VKNLKYADLRFSSSSTVNSERRSLTSKFSDIMLYRTEVFLLWIGRCLYMSNAGRDL